MKILVIEDYPTQRKLAHHVLSAAGHEVSDVGAAEQAFTTMKTDSKPTPTRVISTSLR